MNRLVIISAAASGLILTGCSMLGPKANVSVIDSEIQKTKVVENIIIPYASGIDATGNTGKALLASAIGAYGKRARPVAVAGAVLDSAGAPAGLTDLLVGSYQAEFIKAVDLFAKSKGEKKPKALAMPSNKLDFPVPTGLKGVKTLVEKLAAEKSGILTISKALKSGDNAGFISGIDKSKSTMALVQKMNDLLFAQLDVTYVLLTHVSGNEADWDAGKKVTYSAALVNVKTGKLRYFASVEGQKGKIPTPYMAQISMMSNNLFDAVNEKDELPAASAAAKPKKKKTAAVYIYQGDFR